MITATRAACLTLAILVSQAHTQPIALHPENPHYYLCKGRPTILVTSAEHYGTTGPSSTAVSTT